MTIFWNRNSTFETPNLPLQYKQLGIITFPFFEQIRKEQDKHLKLSCVYGRPPVVRLFSFLARIAIPKCDFYGFELPAI